MQNTLYELLISDWSSDVCSSDLRDQRLDAIDHRIGRSEISRRAGAERGVAVGVGDRRGAATGVDQVDHRGAGFGIEEATAGEQRQFRVRNALDRGLGAQRFEDVIGGQAGAGIGDAGGRCGRSEEHTSELQSLMRSSYAVFCLKKK